MLTAEIVNHLMITVENKVGTLSQVSEVIASAGINLVAICGYTVDHKGFVMFVSDDNRRAGKLLRDKGYNVREEEAVLATILNRPGALQSLAQKIADAGIDLDLIYGSVDPKGKTSAIVLVSENNQAVLTLVKVMAAGK